MRLPKATSTSCHLYSSVLSQQGHGPLAVFGDGVPELVAFFISASWAGASSFPE
ncbi:hypothetical protein [Amycolatopsis sp. cmx-11-51]|uniref:hypothetical protein n=1 Tax=unclassified Amycolatopsis TaxID=2618356 RepID=UPI0039E65BA5